ncbi:hypothetical protein P3339_08125 [Microbulbifer sp. MLAF003]|uniref:hypothetical protein n=1 Tax=unclassified Microbulbifer TaxID=2619833 RepID=UPI0024ACBFA3|nr:hypothetical protein [Microbulbifer sp. MLAF003]WHI52715.1 hypothetical protein P3339_08125 [Microbulbifer sp. MLAF003]
MKFSASLKQFNEDALAEADRLYRATNIELFNSVIRDTPVDTGRARGNWQTTVGTPAQSSSLRLDRSGAEAQAEVIQNVSGLDKVNYLINNLPYIQPLEYGHSKQAPAGMVRRNVLRIKSIIRRIIR